MKQLDPDGESTITRRMLLAGLVLFATSPFVGKVRSFVFKIRTESGSIVSNILIEANDLDAAKAKLMKRYPGCTILGSAEK